MPGTEKIPLILVVLKYLIPVYGLGHRFRINALSKVNCHSFKSEELRFGLKLHTLSFSFVSSVKRTFWLRKDSRSYSIMKLKPQ